MSGRDRLSVEQELCARVAEQGFAFVRAETMRGLLTSYGSLSDWAPFAATWDDLELDTYMADGGRYRRRRYAEFSAAPGGPVVRQPHAAHFQTLDYNRLHGGVARWFAPVTETAGDSASLRTILDCARALSEMLAPTRHWHIELHQFRIAARRGERGQPTPEGMHRDGVDFVLVLLIQRENIASGTTSTQDLQGRELGSFTLTHPFDAAFVEDARVYHGVTAVEPIDPERPAYRDVLVATFRRRS